MYVCIYIYIYIYIHVYILPVGRPCLPPELHQAKGGQKRSRIKEPMPRILVRKIKQE